MYKYVTEANKSSELTKLTVVTIFISEFKWLDEVVSLIQPFLSSLCKNRAQSF